MHLMGEHRNKERMHLANARGTEGCEETVWDEALAQLGGDLLQSWRWGEFKRLQGWSITRLHVTGPNGFAMAQLLVRRAGPLCLVYLPRGPVVAKDGTAATELLKAIDEACAQHRAVVLYVEPHRPLPATWMGAENGFVCGPESFQSARTVKVPLLHDANLLAQMRKDTRANLRHAERRGVIVEHSAITPAAMHTFYELLQETARRNGFGIHGRSYYQDFLSVFGDQATLMFSKVDGVVTAGLIAARFGVEGRSMYAGSSTAHRTRGDTAVLRLEAMRWARAHGCHQFDLGGIATGGPLAAENGHEGQRPQGADLQGVRQFKVGFGGEVVAFPPTMERRYRPAMAWLIRRFHPRFRPAPVIALTFVLYAGTLLDGALSALLNIAGL